MSRMRKYSPALAVLICCFSARQAHAIVVHDPGNAIIMAQQLAQQAQQISNQVRSIHHQIESIENQAKMLQNLDVTNYEQAIAAMLQAQAALRQICVDIDLVPNRIGFDTGLSCNDLLALYRRAYPQAADWKAMDRRELVEFPRQWVLQKREAAAKAMQVQNASVEAMEGNAQRMSELATASRNAPGTKAAQQVTNEMLVALSAQLREQQAAEIAAQRLEAMEQAELSSWQQRNAELLSRMQRDARTRYSVKPVRSPFRRR